MMKISGRWVVAATLGICSAAVNAQDGRIGVDASSEPAPQQRAEIGSPQNHAMRYSAGDSIPLGNAVVAAEQPPPASERAKATAAQASSVRYSAGDSIPLELPQETPGSGAIATETTSRKKGSGYSAAARIPLAGALGDSVTTHIGVSHAGLAESNRIINTSPAGLLGLFVVKAGIVYYFEHQPPAVRKSGLKATAGVWNGFTMNNLLLIAGSSSAVGLIGGALFGAYMYHREGVALEKESRDSTARTSGVQAR